MAEPTASCCRACGHPLTHDFLDLGRMPVSNGFLRAEDLEAPEVFYPLRAMVCDACWLVQLPEVRRADELFTPDYAYFSSFSDSWLRHAQTYAAAMSDALGLAEGSLVLEVASNDGYLLQYFKARGIAVLGIEPCANVAEAARANHGIESVVDFFGLALARRLRGQGVRPALIAANNVLAHVPDLHDFVAGFAELLQDGGLATFEFPHLLELIAKIQFDTIYHEHYSYLSLLALEPVFARHGLCVVDVETLPTHGGSLRLHVRHAAHAPAPSARVQQVRADELAGGLGRLETYTAFADRVRALKRKVVRFLIDAKERGETVVGYGAPAKGNILLNYCGVRGDLMDYTVDRSPHKQGLYLPGTAIPVRAPEKVAETRPDYVLILPWNLKDEIMAQMSHIRGWGGRFVLPVPDLEILP